MLIAGDHLPYYDALEGAAGLLDAFHLHTQHGDALAQFLNGPVEVDVFLEPVISDFHRALKLAQEARVIFVKEPDVVDAVAQHGDAFDTEAKRPTAPFLGIEPDLLQHSRMHHAATGNL